MGSGASSASPCSLSSAELASAVAVLGEEYVEYADRLRPLQRYNGAYIASLNQHQLGQLFDDLRVAPRHRGTLAQSLLSVDGEPEPLDSRLLAGDFRWLAALSTAELEAIVAEAGSSCEDCASRLQLVERAHEARSLREFKALTSDLSPFSKLDSLNQTVKRPLLRLLTLQGAALEESKHGFGKALCVTFEEPCSMLDALTQEKKDSMEADLRLVEKDYTARYHRVGMLAMVRLFSACRDLRGRYVTIAAPLPDFTVLPRLYTVIPLDDTKNKFQVAEDDLAPFAKGDANKCWWRSIDFGGMAHWWCPASTLVRVRSIIDLLESESNSPQDVVIGDAWNAVLRETGIKEEESVGVVSMLVWLIGALQLAENPKNISHKRASRALLGCRAFTLSLLPEQRLLGNGQHTYMTVKGEQSLWSDFIKLCMYRLMVLGLGQEEWFQQSHESMAPVQELGKRYWDANIRLDALLPPNPAHCNWDNQLCELIYMHVVALAALAIEPSFQSCLRTSWIGEGSRLKFAPPKSYTRMANKFVSDHARSASPKAGCNVDINRAALTCDNADELADAFRAIAEIREVKLVRCKNNMRLDMDASNTFHYRAILANYEFRPGMTWGELMSNPRVVADFDAYYKRSLGADPEVRIIVESAIRWLRSPTMAEKLAVTMVEVQFLCKEYLELRKRMHPWYKIVRAEHPLALFVDCRAGMLGGWSM